MSPLLTLAMPVYNAMPYLRQAVDSVLAQTYRDFRFLIIDDGSTDDSAAYLAQLREPRITIVRQGNIGLGATLNRSLDLCDTPLYARMDADDIALPGRLSAQVAFLEQNPSIVLVGTQIGFAAGETILPASPFPQQHERILALLLRGEPIVCHPSVMFRRDEARALRGYRIPGAGEDFDFFIRMAERGRLANLGQVLLHYRIHEGSIVSSSQGVLLCGIDYACACAAARRQAATEPDYAAFFQTWQGSRKNQLRAQLAAGKVRAYRQSLRARAAGRRWTAWGWLLWAAVCAPQKAGRRLFRRWTE